MRLKIQFEPVSGSSRITGEFPRRFQAAIYASLHPELAQLVHDQGFSVGSRAFKMIVFSDVMFQKKPMRDDRGLRFVGPASIIVASPMRELLSSFATFLLRTGEFRVGNESFNLIGLTADDTTVDTDEIEVRSLSPIVAYSTLLRPDGRKYTCYFQPGESDFERLIAENLARKYAVVYGNMPENDVKVEVRRCGRMVIRNFKGTIVKGWHCLLRLRGPGELLTLALDAGLGAKNAQGWGCVEAVTVTN